MKLLCALSAVSTLLTVNPVKAEDWPHSNDIPVQQPLSVGLAGDKPIDIARFLLARGPAQAAINSRGTQVAFMSNVTGRYQLWVQDLNNGQAKQLTWGNGISFFQWHPDGKRLIYGADNDGDEREAFFIISANGKTESLLLPYSDGFRSFGSFSGDGSKFTYASTERNGRDFDIYLHDMNSGESKMVWQAEFGFFPQAWRPGSDEVVVTETRGEDADDLHLLATDSKQMTALLKPKVAASFADFNWTADGKTLYFTSNLDREMSAIFTFDPVTKKARPLITSQFDIDELTLCGNDSTLLWVENREGLHTLMSQAVSGEEPQEVPLPDGVYQVSCADDNANILVQVSGPSTPSELHLIDGKTMTRSVVRKADMAGIAAESLVQPLQVSFKARDGVTLYGQLYLPKGLTKPAPVVVDVHGGPTSQAVANWQPLAQYLTGKGIAVLDINVRGSTGYGKTFTRLDNQEKRLDSVRDLVDALTWMQGDKRLDASNAAVMGGSYGGYMVNAVMGKYPDAFKAGASFVGVSDWVRALQNASPALKASDRIEYGDIREQKWQTFYADNSPINTVDKIQAPMFYEHGANDPRDPVTESDRMVRILREKGLPVTYLRFPDEGHSVSKLENRVTFYRELAAFLERHLKQAQ